MTTGQSPERAADSFSGLLLRHRGRTGLTQRQFAARVGVSRRAVQDWESGLNCPDAQHLQALIAVFLEAGGLALGDAATDAEALWAAALREAPRMHTPFDAVWWADVLSAWGASAATSPARPSTLAKRNDEASRGASRADEKASHADEKASHADEKASHERHRDVTNSVGTQSVMQERRQDWGEAPDVVGFVGRAAELATLRGWVLAERCRLVAVLGMGGIGKTALAARVAQEVAPVVQRVYWRSLRNALPVSEWLGGAIEFLSDQRVVPPDGEAERLTLLLQLLRDRPCLLVLDNFETVLEPGQPEGRYRDGRAGYGRLLRAIGEGRHQSCLVVTSREAPAELSILGGGAVRTLQPGGLGVTEGQVLLADRQLSGNPADWTNLIDRVGGNALALKQVAESIRELSGGDIGAFLEVSGSGVVFGAMGRLLAEQIERSSALEQKVLRVLAVARAPMSIPHLVATLRPQVTAGAVLEAVEALRRRSLVERADGPDASAFTLQPVLLNYLSERMVEETRAMFARSRRVQLIEEPPIKPQAKDVRAPDAGASDRRATAPPAAATTRRSRPRSATPGAVRRLARPPAH